MRRQWIAMSAIVFATVLTALTGCQSTTEGQPGEQADNTYPDRAGSPGLSGNTIMIGTPGVSDQESAYWEIYGPVYLALKELFADVNARGGVLGYQVEQVPIDDGLGPERTVEALASARCSYAIVQHPSFAFNASYENIPLGRQAGCISATRGINILSTRLIGAAELAETPDVVAPYALDDVAAGRTLVRRLAARGFFEGATKVAVLSPGTVYAGTANDIVAEEVRAQGFADPMVITTADSAQAEANSIALQMKSAGVDRVIWLGDATSGYPAASAMASQDFTPPLGFLNSVNAGAVGSFYPVEQLHLVSTLGGYQEGNEGDPEFATVPDTPASQRCEQALESTGLRLPPGGNFSLLIACDALALTIEALTASGADEPSAAAFFDGLARLDTFDSAFGVPLDFSHGRTGAAQVWDLQGDTACACMKVVGGPHPVERG